MGESHVTKRRQAPGLRRAKPRKSIVATAAGRRSGRRILTGDTGRRQHPGDGNSPRATGSAAPTATRCGRIATRGRRRRTRRPTACNVTSRPGPVNFVETKAYASREVWVHFTGQVEAPIKVTRHVPNSSCERSGCHTGAEIDKKIQLGTPAPAPFDHGSAGHTKQLCIDCHASLVHGGVPGNAQRTGGLDGVVLLVPHRRGQGLRVLSHGAARRSRSLHRLPLAAVVGSQGLQASQPLVGKHAQIACEQCHTQGVSVKPDGCITCHGDQHNGLTNCVDCHRIAAWTPTHLRPSAGGTARARRRRTAAVRRLPPGRVRPEAGLSVSRRQSADRRLIGPRT